MRVFASSPCTSVQTTSTSLSALADPTLTFLGWSLATRETDSQRGTSVPIPTNLVPSGGTIRVCGQDRLVYWVTHKNARLPFGILNSFIKPNGKVINNGESTYRAGDSYIRQSWGYLDAGAMIGSADVGTFTGQVELKGKVVATGTVAATC
jgi:hypothetical protein